MLLGWIVLTLRDAELLGFSEGRAGWDGMGSADLGSASKRDISAYFY